jgi:hypothetical protein
MYIVENLNTLAEIKITTVEYSSLVLSNTIVIKTGVGSDEIKDHSINTLKLYFREYKAGNIITITVAHISHIVCLGRYLFIMNSNQ